MGCALRNRSGLAENWCGARSSDALVAMMQTSDTRPGYDLSSTGAARPLFWGLLPESTVRAILVVVPDVTGKQPFEMQLVEGDHLIQQFLAKTLSGSEINSLPIVLNPSVCYNCRPCLTCPSLKLRALAE
jgi:hypothetical protein